MPQVKNLDAFCHIDWPPLDDLHEIRLADIPETVRKKYVVRAGTRMPYSGRKVVE